MSKLSLSVFLTALAAAVPTQAKLTVHEWGTFTVLQAPDGSTLQWYLASKDIAPLPSFVSHARQGFQVLGKTGTAQRRVNGQWVGPSPYAVRMETPVIYFYPDAPMDVKVDVNFPEGQITEFFPKAQTGPTGASWQGRLMPVTPESLKTVPDATGPQGRHYAAARAVPEAWLYRNAVPMAPFKPAPGPSPSAHPMIELLPPPQIKNESVSGTDHFIFYRGAGNRVPMNLSAITKDDHTFTLRNRQKETVPVLFVLRVADRKSTWKRVDNLQQWNPLQEHQIVQVSLPDTSEPLATSTAQLKTEMLSALEKEGLTKSEAAAMVATWDNLWFEEPGTRVLAVLPQPWVDTALPLQITPKPDSLERVFVARLELISNVQQNALAALLDHPPAAPAAAREQMQKLALGRFAPGAVERAVALKKREMQARFEELSRPEPAKGIASVLKSMKPEDLKAVRDGMRKVVESSTTPAVVPPAQ
jgi:hypothetical protein